MARRFKLFQTRKKSYNSIWVHWGILFAISLLLLSLFLVSEVLQMHERKISFYNIHALNFEEKAVVKHKNKFTNQTPTFIFHKDKVIFGTLAAASYPQKKGDILIFDAHELKNYKRIKDKIKKYSGFSHMLPFSIFGVGFGKTEDEGQKIKRVEALFNILSSLNTEAHQPRRPIVTFLDILEGGS